jgi:acetyl-CoA carboxylase biotin carboxylase subunit
VSIDTQTSNRNFDGVIEGIKTTIPFHIRLMDDPGFKSGKFTTAFMDTFDMTGL